MSTTIHHVSNPLSRGCASCILTPSWASNSRRVGHLVNEQPSFQAPSTQLIWAERDFICVANESPNIFMLAVNAVTSTRACAVPGSLTPLFLHAVEDVVHISVVVLAEIAEVSLAKLLTALGNLRVVMPNSIVFIQDRCHTSLSFRDCGFQMNQFVASTGACKNACCV